MHPDMPEPDSNESGPRRSRGPETIQRVLDAAFGLVSRDGIHAVTMLAIAREAGVAEKTVYNIFGSKTNLAARLVELYQTTVVADFALSDFPDVDEIFASIRAIALDLSRNLNWSQTIAGLYFSNDVEPATYARLQEIGLRHLDAAIALTARPFNTDDQPNLALARHQFANLGYGLVHDLAAGRIDGSQLGDHLCYGLAATLRSLFGSGWRSGA